MASTGKREPTSTDDAASSPADGPLPIPPLLTEPGDADATEVITPDEQPTTVEPAAAATSSTTDSQAADAVKAAAAAIDAPPAGADEKASPGRGARAKGRLGKAAAEAREIASDARGMAARGASEARGRASNTDVKEIARSTTSLIDTARPFFLAGCAALFAMLGFFEGDSGTAQVFAVGSILCVGGAAFSGEINAFLHARAAKALAAAKRESGEPPEAR